MKYEFKFYLPTTSVNSKHSSSIIVWQIRVPCWVEKKRGKQTVIKYSEDPF